MTLPATTRQYQLTKAGSYKNLQIKEVPVNPPKPHDVLVKVHAVSLQYRDLLVASGTYLAPCADQVIPCSDMAGEVIALGEGVQDWKIGDRVCANFSTDHIYGDSTFAIQQTSLGGQAHGVLTQYRTFPAHSLVKVPEHYSYEEASTLPCAALTAYNALHGPTPVKAGDYVLVLGTGGVSIWGLQIAVAAGAIVIATSSSDEKLAIATKLGAKHVINYNKTPNWDQEILKITNGAGVDHVIEVGGQGTLSRSLNSARVGGSVHVIGFVSQDKNNFEMVMIIGKAIALRGVLIGSVAQFRDMNRLIAANPEKTRPVIDKVFSFDKALDAYAHLESQKHVGKVVIKVA
ncbi:NAD(P)-binding protein [Macrolepiota fuliginosa MF-IS2]|uniref:NAD(P)-binding protein n=1 Tax=Macrolepiota fuliginosa MF-IS2 TaxID=1400762 RepID=A0A9P5XHX6_9AGAR|nr:NAD(P)-binding protein [Macrolepiota fuliginosa MF-IS2]